MKRFLSLTLCLVMVMAAGTALANTKSASTDVSELQIVAEGEGILLHSTTSSQSLLMRETAGPDTFDLYGGTGFVLRDPDGVANNGDEYVEGKFQDATGFTPRGLSPNPGDWTGVDLTDQPTFWNVNTFNAENLNNNGAGNNAMWSGLDAGLPETAGWAAAPGYGNNWTDNLLFESAQLPDPSQGQTVSLDFFFNYDTEPAYDFFSVDYDSAGTWINVYSADGTNKDTLTGVFPAPGAQFSLEGAAPIVYAGNDYTDDRVRIRIIFSSDGAFSDEDGLFVGDGGAQVDDITVNIPALGSSFENFEGAAPYLWNPEKAAFAGNFASTFAAINDIDPCRDNLSPTAGFIDFGQAPDNGPGVDGTVDTGGSLSSTWDYGIPGGFVFNYTGGLTGGDVPMNNEVWSPEFVWDLPGTEDDGVAVSGSALAFSVWQHMPLSNGIFYVWHVRSSTDGGATWGTWQDRNFVYFSTLATWTNRIDATTDLIPQGVTNVQIGLGGLDLSGTFAFPGTDATPAPLFDNVRFYKFRIGGVPITTRTIDTANDGFPVSGDISVADQAARDLLDVPFDMARDISSGDLNVPGDSVIVDAAPVIPGTTLDDIRMVWALRQNPLFEAAIRQQPNRPLDENFASTVDGNGFTIWTGEVVADSSRTAAAGVVVADRYFASVPDEDFMYPGDILHYYFQATDSDLRVTTLPGNTTGFGEWDANGQSDYSRAWTVRALPSITDAAGAQPSILLYNDFGRRGGEAEVLGSFNQLGLLEGRDFDSYTTQGPSSGVSNGLGSAGVTNALGDRRGHGANADQLGGYSTIVYLGGNLNTQLISDGSNTGNNDKSPDIQVLTGWKNLAGPRNTVYFGDYVSSGVVTDSPVDGATYVSTVMGVDVISNNVRQSIGGQTAPTVRATGNVAGFATEFVAFGGCLGINEFDDIRPAGTAVAGHGFVNPGTDGLYPDIAASVIFDRVVGVDRKVDITFPFGNLFVYNAGPTAVPGVSARSILLEEILDFVGENSGTGDVTAAPDARKASFDLYPNPFNPKTVASFSLPKAGVQATVKVFNVRGELVRTLHDGIAGSANLTLEWNGTDNGGRSVASGVYLVKAVTEGFSATKKAVLVK